MKLPTEQKYVNRKQKWEEKQLYGYFKWQTSDFSHKKTWTWLRKEKPKRETKSFLIATQNIAIRKNYIKAKIDKTQQNSKCRLCGDRNEMINYIISKCTKLAKKENKIRHGWEGKVIYWELCEKF